MRLVMLFGFVDRQEPRTPAKLRIYMNGAFSLPCDLLQWTREVVSNTGDVISCLLISGTVECYYKVIGYNPPGPNNSVITMNNFERVDV